VLSGFSHGLLLETWASIDVDPKDLGASNVNGILGIVVKTLKARGYKVK